LPFATWPQGDPEWLSGKVFLVASPSVEDPFFRQSVVLVLPSGQDEAIIGLIINRPTTLPLGHLFPREKSLQQLPIPVHFGGPVNFAAPAFLVRAKNRPAKLLHLFEDVYLGTDIDVLKALVTQATADKNFRVYLGHAGWTEDQLDGEIAEGGWYVLPADASAIFSTKPESLWSTLVARAQMRRVAADPPVRLRRNRLRS
jgi:putative transcriptional regulator